MAKIETGVDKLVELINTQKKISVDEAAKRLGVSKVVIEEWADFLEEEKIISIEYKFNTTLLVERKLSNNEIKEKAEEFVNEKDAFIRKVESGMKSIENDSSGLQKIKEEFSKLKKELGGQIDKVKNEVTELEKYESLKKNLDKQIEAQQKEYSSLIGKLHQQISNEEVRYKDLLGKISKEKQDVDEKEQHMKSLTDQEVALRSKLKAIFELAKTTEAKIDAENREISAEEGDLKGLEQTAHRMEDEVMQKKEAMQPLINKAREQEKQIMAMEDEILKKVKEKTSEIESRVKTGEFATAKFEAFFNKKKEIEALINKIDKDKEYLKDELANLIRKATAFDVSTKSANVKNYINDLEKDLKKVEGKRDGFKKELTSLLKLIRG